MADLEVRSPTAAPGPTQPGHLVTRGYVDQYRNNVEANTRTAAYTLVLGDAGRVVEMNATTALTLTVPANATVAFPLGTSVYVTRLGTGTVTIAAATDVTINTANSLTLGAQYSTVWLRKRTADQWILVAL